MKTFYELYEQLQKERYFERLALDPLAQFGSEQQQLLGARLMPERPVEENSYEETQVRYRTKPALDNNRYSPTQKQDNSALIGSFRVDLGHTDTRKDLTGKEYEDIGKLLMRDGDMQAIANVINFVDKELVQPHIIKNEIQRWQAWLLASVTRETANGDMQAIDYYRPDDHIVTVPGGTIATPAGWHADGYDLFDDIEAGKEKLQALGYPLVGMYSTPYLGRVMRTNSEVIKRNGRTIPNDTAPRARVTESILSVLLEEEDYTGVTLYNGGYESENGFKRYMDVEPGYDYLLMVGGTQRSYEMASEYTGAVSDPSKFTDSSIVLDNTLGYYAVGKNAGKNASGRTIHTWMQDRKPVGMAGESYQTGLPVITDPQAYYVIRVQRPA